MGTSSTTTGDELSPEKRLESSNKRLIKAGIATIADMDTLRACVAYENTQQNRPQILRRLKWKAEELREEK
ncbi:MULTISPECIES: hypothetical protein [Halolamina]|uniref:hypothetical protein n=1 Tax=Halolamina TaxID=1075397 RepID=UPI000942DB41|nr:MULTISPECIES: hypothetical protein [Halolamina]NHX37534.1 hypothetical protein [Halolamina sp. R1-12]